MTDYFDSDSEVNQMNWMTAKFKGECVSCTRNIDEGERILFDFEEREAYCSKCGERIKPDPKKEWPL